MKILGLLIFFAKHIKNKSWDKLDNLHKLKSRNIFSIENVIIKKGNRAFRNRTQYSYICKIKAGEAKSI